MTFVVQPLVDRILKDLKIRKGLMDPIGDSFIDWYKKNKKEVSGIGPRYILLGFIGGYLAALKQYDGSQK